MELIIMMLVVGLAVGGLARLALPGTDPMSIPMTMGLGLAGAIVGGFLGSAIFGEPSVLTLVLQVGVATGFVYLVRQKKLRAT